MVAMFRISAILVLAALLFIAVMRLLFPLPSLEGRQPSSAIPAGDDTALNRNIQPVVVSEPGKSGILPLFEGTDAFSARMLLARSAQTSIDAQYYIWQNDLTGIPLLNELRIAAERGVRVRLLVDDNGTPDLDAELAALNALPTAEVRVFNPFNLRNPRLLSYLFDFFRLNRRMHNKSFTVDGTATIIGGRNIGDIYFARDAETQYSDLDLLAVGQVVPDVAAEFDLYWNSQSAYPHELLVDPPADGLAVLDRRQEEVKADPGTDDYVAALQDSTIVRNLAAGTLALHWAETQLVADDPAKGLGKIADNRLMITQLAKILGTVRSGLDLISAYFVPGDRGVDALAAAVAGGAKVRTLTNSLDATDVLPVHASYAKYRRKLLAAGVSVFELKSHPTPRMAEDDLRLFGGSASSLHAKTLILDNDRVFVGSFNFDPRSVFLNCEMGFLVRSPELAAQVSQSFQQMISEESWQVTRDDSGGLMWTDVATGSVETTEPGSSAVRTFMLMVLGWLPVEWLM